MDEFELTIKQVPPVGDYWLTLKRTKGGDAMNMHLDFDDIVKIRDHLNHLILLKRNGEAIKNE
jgi:hypothetical protein